MFSRRSNLVLGYHGLDESIGRKIVSGQKQLLPSENDYDWLGHGIYFWENSLVRAQQWAVKQSKGKKTSVNNPFAIGAVIDLGNCLDLLDQQWLDFVGETYKIMAQELEFEGKELPQNLPWTYDDIDFKNRQLDCAVILYAIQSAKAQGKAFDSVRAAFWEGEDLYPHAGFKQHNHIQISIINPDCIRGIFLPK